VKKVKLLHILKSKWKIVKRYLAKFFPVQSEGKKRRGKNYGRFLKMMIDDLQTPLYKTNHKYRSYFPLDIILINNQAKKLNLGIQAFKRIS
jgi:hypothetical protein